MKQRKNKRKQTILYSDDFSDLPVGVICGDYTPAGEYHVVPALVDSGRWRETVIHYSYKNSRGNWQVVLETDDTHVLEQTILAPAWEPMLVTGWPYDWPATSISAAIRPLTMAGWRAIIFRYTHARKFYAAAFSDQQVRVLRREFDQDTPLGEAPCELDCETYTPVRIECSDNQITVTVADRQVLTCADDKPQAAATGGVGFAATDLTRFRDLDVRTTPELAEKYATQKAEQQKAISHSRSNHPRAVLWKKIKTPRWGTDRNLRVGDINGDGQNEIVLARSTDRLAGGNACIITSLAAYNLNGEQLWTVGEPNPINTYHTTADLCFQVHDLDRDGCSEVYFARDFEFFRANGRTGKTESLMPLPLTSLEEGLDGRIYRTVGDSFCFCDLTGSGYPDSMILKDRYWNAWAYDREFKLLWHVPGNTGHYPFAADINSDGRDEVLLGYHLLTADGAENHSLPFIDHADNIVFAHLHDSGTADGNSQTRIVLAGSDAGFYILDLERNIRAHHPLGHAQSICIANLLPQRSGVEIMCNTFWGPAGITAVMDEAGNMLNVFEPMPYACLLQPVNWVPLSAGDLPADLVLLSTHPDQGGLIDGNGTRQVMFPDDGHPVLCSDARDIDGDGIDEILTWDHNEIWIYKADSVPGRTLENYPKRAPWYNDSNYRVQTSRPCGYNCP